jgi:MYXO-CTERM domain-containing protein
MQRTKILLAQTALFLVAASPSQAQNLLANPDFDTDLSPWEAGAATIGVSFDAVYDVNANDGGSARVASGQTEAGGPGNAGSGMVQCVNVTPDTLYEISAFALIPASQDRTANPDVRLVWFEVADCAPCPPQNPICFIQGPATNQHSGATETFEELVGSGVAPSTALSANIVARPRKNEAGGTVNVVFDAFFLPEPDAPALALAAAATLALLRRRRS